MHKALQMKFKSFPLRRCCWKSCTVCSLIDSLTENVHELFTEQFVLFERWMCIWRISCLERIMHETYSRSQNLIWLIKTHLLRVKSALTPSNHKPVSHCGCKEIFNSEAAYCAAVKPRSLEIEGDTCTVSSGLSVLPYKPQTLVRQSYQDRHSQRLCFYKNRQTPHEKIQKKKNQINIGQTLFLLQDPFRGFYKRAAWDRWLFKKKANEVGKQLWNALDVISKSLTQLWGSCSYVLGFGSVTGLVCLEESRLMTFQCEQKDHGWARRTVAPGWDVDLKTCSQLAVLFCNETKLNHSSLWALP